MTPCFGIEYQCPSLKWIEVMKGPSRQAVLAHTYKVLHYRALFPTQGSQGQGEAGRSACDELAPDLPSTPARYSEAA